MLSFAIGKTFLPPLFDAPLEEKAEPGCVFGDFGGFRNRADDRGTRGEEPSRRKEAT